MAAPHGSGPRRVGGVPLSSLVVTASPPAAAPPTAPEVLPPGGADAEAPLLPARARAAALTVAAALHSVNLFVRPVVVSDAAVVARGRLKTWVFAVAFVVVVVTLLMINLVQEATVSRTVLWPSPAQYAAIEGYAPSCACSVPGTVLSNVATLTVPPEANFSVNAAFALSQLYSLCGGVMATPDNPSLGPCVGTDAGALAWIVYLQPLSIMSYSFASHFAEYTAATMAMPVGPTLLAPDALTAFVEDTVLQQMRLFWLLANQALQGDVAVSVLSIASSFELTAGARATSPPGCTCAGTANNPSPAAQAANQCFFQPAFDTRPTNNNTMRWVCNVPVSLVFFPMDLLLLDATYEALALPPPYTRFTNFSGAASFANSSGATFTGFNQFVSNSMSAIFPLDAARVPMPVSLTPGLVTVSFDAHFATCHPSSCAYVYSSRPSPATALTAALGLISGAQTVLMLAVDRGIDFLCARRAAPSAAGAGKASSAGGREAGGDDDSDEDGGDGRL